MLRIKTHLVLTALLGCFFALTAQQTLYYPNGQKAIQGSWRIGSFAVMPSNFNDFTSRDHSMERNRKIMNVPGYPGYYWEYNETLLGMHCTGPVSMWYPDGKPMAEVNFTNGIISGNYIAYHENGNKAMEGMMEDGMPSGPWKTYYSDGQVFFTGAFAAHSQAELQDRFAAAYALRTDPYALKKVLERADEEYDTLRNDLAIATDGLRYLFVDAMPQSSSLKQGKFTVYKQDGRKWAEMAFIKNVRDGSWIMYNDDGLPKYELYYDKGKLLAVKEGQHPKETVQAYAARWAREEKKRQQASANNEILDGVAMPVRNFTWADEMPGFGESIQQYVLRNASIDEHVRMKDIAGEYIASFYVEPDGHITRVRIETGKNKALNKEIIRVIESMPPWKPGTHNGKPASMPVRIRLSVGLTTSY